MSNQVPSPRPSPANSSRRSSPPGPSHAPLSRVSQLALLGSQSDLEPDKRPDRGNVYVNKSELHSFKADSPRADLDQTIKCAKLATDELPSLISFEKTLEGRFRHFQASFTEKKEPPQKRPKPVTAEKTRPSFQMGSKFERMLSVSGAKGPGNRPSFFELGTEGGPNEEETRSLLGKRERLEDHIQCVNPFPFKSPSKRSPRKLSEKQKIRILTRKILKSYKLNVKMAINVFKKMCIMNVKSPNSANLKGNSNAPKSFVLREEDLDTNSHHLPNATESKSQSRQEERIKAPPNSKRRKRAVSQSCREFRLWTELLDKIKRDSERRRRRRRPKKKESDRFSFRKIERRSFDAKQIMTVQGAYEFLDLSFKNINKDKDNN